MEELVIDWDEWAERVMATERGEEWMGLLWGDLERGIRLVPKIETSHGDWGLAMKIRDGNTYRTSSTTPGESCPSSKEGWVAILKNLYADALVARTVLIQDINRPDKIFFKHPSGYLQYIQDDIFARAYLHSTGEE